MQNLLKLLIKTRLNRKLQKLSNSTSGFTMIELLVGTIISFLIIVPMLTFVVDILNRDVREEAKANTEQEIQTALDYIKQDLSQAVYIYNNTGINSIANQVAFDNRTPILVFWKRQFVENIVPIPGCNDCEQDDAYVYALVAYYVSTNNPNNIWSNAVRIERFELRDRVVNYLLPSTDTNYVIEAADPGFNIIPVSDPTIETDDNDPLPAQQQKMNQWTRDGDFNDSPDVLVDYIYQGAVADAGIIDCTDIFPVSQENGSDVPGTGGQLIGTANSGFYACVDSSRTLAKVFIRGNGLARIQDNAPTCNANSTYCPTGSITVEGRSLLGS